jgi:eukaryotic-like serine/threonine-protein kinase
MDSFDALSGVFSTFEILESVEVTKSLASYRCLDKDNDRSCLLKVLNPKCSQMYHKRFDVECDIGERFDHPNIVKVYSSGTHNGLKYLLREACTEKASSNIEAYAELDWHSIGERFEGLLGALEQFHDHGIVHRNIRPSNFFLGEQGELKLGNYGTSLSLAGEFGIDKRIFGHVQYMPIEQFYDSNNIKPDVDLYALGISFYEILSGELPFVADGLDRKVWREIHSKKYPKALTQRYGEDLPKGLTDFIDRLMQKISRFRYVNAGETLGHFKKIMLGNDLPDLEAQDGGYGVSEETLQDVRSKLNQGEHEEVEDAPAPKPVTSAPALIEYIEKEKRSNIIKTSIAGLLLLFSTIALGKMTIATGPAIMKRFEFLEDTPLLDEKYQATKVLGRKGARMTLLNKISVGDKVYFQIFCNYGRGYIEASKIKNLPK